MKDMHVYPLVAWKTIDRACVSAWKRSVLHCCWVIGCMTVMLIHAALTTARCSSSM